MTRNIYGIPSEYFIYDGTYEINIVTTDRAGNVNDTREGSLPFISFVKDTTAPGIIPINIKDDISINSEEYKAEFIISDNIMLDISEGYINGVKTDIACDGGKYYMTIRETGNPADIEIIASDKAGNTYSLKISNVLVTTNPVRRSFHDHYREIGAGMDVAGLFGLMLIRVLRRCRSIVI